MIEDAPKSPGTAPSPVLTAVLAGSLAAVLFLLPRLSAGMPVLALPLGIAGLFSAVPLMFVRLYGGLFHALLATAQAILLLSVIDSPDTGIGFAVLFGLWALVAGEVMSRRKSVVLGCVAGLVVLSLEASLAMAAEGTAAIEEAVRSPQLQTAFDQWATQAQLDPQEAKATIEGVRNAIISLYPSLSIVSAATIVALNAFALGRLVGRLRVPSFPKGELMMLRWPLALVVAFVGSGAMLMLPDMEVLGWNGLVVTLFLFLLQGLSVMTFALSRLFASELMRTLLVVGSLLGPWAIFLSLVGLFDQWFDFRGRFASTETPAAPSNSLQ
ncbi:MAG: DUF2232 domain-containing protein [Vicinamibacteria bacterium]